MASLPYPRSPPNSFHRTTLSLLAQVLPRNSRNSQKLQAEDILPRISQMLTEVSGGEEPPTDFTDVHRFLGCVLPPNLCTSVQSVGVFVGGYGIPAIPTPPSEFLPQNPFQVCLRKSSHGIHGIHRNFWRRIFSHGLHRFSQKSLGGAAVSAAPT